MTHPVDELELVALLRDVPLPEDPADRFASVQRRRRRTDNRRFTVVGAALSVIVAVASVSAVALRDDKPQSASTLLSSPTSTARAVTTYSSGGQVVRYETLIDFKNKKSIIRGPKGSDFEIRQIGDDTWMTNPGLPLPEGKRWLHSHGSGFSGGFGYEGFEDPAKLVDSIRSHGYRLTPTGTVDVDGKQMKRYHVEAAKDDDEEVFDILVDDLGRLRRVTMQETAAPPSSESMSYRMDLTYVAIAVDVEPPPASQVAESLQGAESTQGGGAYHSSCTITVHSGDAQGEATTAQPCASVSTEVTATTPEDRQRLCDQLTRKANADTRMTQEQRDQVIAAACKGLRP